MRPPDARPGEAIIVFDGVCALCSGWVRFLLRRDRAGRFRFAALQGEAGRALLAAHGLDADDPLSFLLIEPERARTDSDAVIAVLTTLGGVWRLAGMLRAIPESWRDAAYRRLARSRYRWFGRNDACFVPDAAQRDRFLESVV